MRARAPLRLSNGDMDTRFSSKYNASVTQPVDLNGNILTFTFTSISKLISTPGQARRHRHARGGDTNGSWPILDGARHDDLPVE